MARKGRKDSGELYEVFRKITSQQGEQPVADLLARAPEEPAGDRAEEESRADGFPVRSAPAPGLDRAFIVSYNTAVILFMAVVIVIAWAYSLGVKTGEERIKQDRSVEGAKSIGPSGDATIDDIPLESEYGTDEEEYTVEVFRVEHSPRRLDWLDKSIRQPLENQNKGYKTFIAESEDKSEYVLWINRFPPKSGSAERTLTEMKEMPSRSGGKAFESPRLVTFDESRVVRP